MKLIGRSDFLINPDIVFLNHGSFGACPGYVFEAYQNWQMRLEHQPVAFITGKLNRELCRSRERLAGFVGADARDLLFIPNATHGVNQVLRSLSFLAGDEILTTDQEYGACENALGYMAEKAGAVVVKQQVPLPARDEHEWITQFWQGVTDRTKLIFISHITSATAQIYPVEKICELASAVGILTLIDGAHAPGQIDLNLEEIGADFYTGNCHKWLMAPKGSAFLHVRRDRQEWIEPLVVGWGFSQLPEFETGSAYLDQNQWLGTDDFSSYLAVADAIDYYEKNEWLKIRSACSQILGDALSQIQSLTGLPSYVAPHDQGLLQMGIAKLPYLKDRLEFKRRLLEEFFIEIPVIEWQGQHFIRISIQGYNSSDDVACLINALTVLLNEKPPE